MITPDEIDFLAENCSIDVVPNFRHERMHLICGDVGPFEPARPVTVPLWLALSLRRRFRCRLVPPDWLRADALQERCNAESNSAHFTPMPCDHYQEVAVALLDVAADDIPHADTIRTLLKDIVDLRQAKLRSSVDAFLKSDASHARLDNITRMELNTVRPLLNHSLDQLYRLKRDTYRNVSAALRQHSSQ